MNLPIVSQWPFMQFSFPAWQASLSSEQLQRLILKLQYGAVRLFSQLLTSPQRHSPLWHVSPAVMHASRLSEHLQIELSGSQTGAVKLLSQLSWVPHMHFPPTHVSPGFRQADTLAEQLQIPAWLSQNGAEFQLDKHESKEPHWHECSVSL